MNRINTMKGIKKRNDLLVDEDVNDIDFQNYKGIFFGESHTERYEDEETGAHFEYNDLCKKLSNLKLPTETNSSFPESHQSSNCDISEEKHIIDLNFKKGINPGIGILKKINESRNVNNRALNNNFTSFKREIKGKKGQGMEDHLYYKGSLATQVPHKQLFIPKVGVSLKTKSNSKKSSSINRNQEKGCNFNLHSETNFMQKSQFKQQNENIDLNPINYALSSKASKQMSSTLQLKLFNSKVEDKSKNCTEIEDKVVSPKTIVELKNNLKSLILSQNQDNKKTKIGLR